jgi:hypothetical protein
MPLEYLVLGIEIVISKEDMRLIEKTLQLGFPNIQYVW